MSTRRTFTEEFKRDAVRLAREQGNVAEAARDLGVHESLLSRWNINSTPARIARFPGRAIPKMLSANGGTRL